MVTDTQSTESKIIVNKLVLVIGKQMKMLWWEMPSSDKSVVLFLLTRDPYSL